MKNYLILNIILLFLTLNCEYYTNVIELYIRPDRRFLKEKYDNGVCDFSIGRGSIIRGDKPITVREGDGSLFFSDGFNIYLDERDPLTCHDIHYSLAKKILKKTIQGVNGVFGCYRGYVSISDESGLLTFPSFETNKKITIIITKFVSPLILKGKIPADFFISKSDKSKWFICEAEEFADFTLKWTIKEIMAPENWTLPENALVLLCDPKSVYFDEEPFISMQTNNILIPTLFAKGDFTRGIYAMYAMEMLRYYKPIRLSKKSSSFGEEKHFAELIENL
jgi:hypothetical protein